ncbi:MAG: RDD family protein, partial [Pseudomonadota bacterium]
MTDWFYQRRGEAIGPVPGAALAAMLNDGTLHDTTLIKSAIGDKWVEAWEVDQAKLMSAALGQRDDEGYVTPATTWRRIVAYVIDGILINVAFAILLAAVWVGLEDVDISEQQIDTSVFWLHLAFSSVYFGLTIGSKMQATIGKYLMGLRVITV